MAQIVAGLGCSHAPSIAHAYDTGISEEPGWRPLFRAFSQARRWLMSQRPDALVVIFNDHVDSCPPDAWPTFAIGVNTQFAIADEGWGPRRFPAVPGHCALARHLATSLVAANFDLTVSRRMELDHGFLSPMPLLDEDWAVPVVPISINVVFEPLPTPARCYALGAAIGEAVKSFPQDIRVAIIGTGGLSHQLTGPEFGKITPEWDLEFMQRLADDPQELAAYSMADFARLGGEHSIEVVQWLVMRAAVGKRAALDLKFYYPYGLMGYGIAGFRVVER
jgi:protocatechuate 4,5-dioxygenase beta chain